MISRLLTVALSLIWLCGPARAEFMRGGDFSELQVIEDAGVGHSEGSPPTDPLRTFKACGGNTVRLRLFVHPDGTEAQVNGLEYTLRLAKRVKAEGLSLLLDLHYSDGWADPTHQNTPAAWQKLNHRELVDQVRQYTAETLRRFDQAGAMPDMVEVGNEITNGFLWPDGGPLADPGKWNTDARFNGDTPEPWDRFAELLKSGIAGVKDADPASKVRIMVHIDQGGNAAVSKWFFDNLIRRGVQFDVIGLSYYPFWHGTMNGLKANLSALAGDYGKDIIVVETAYDTDGSAQGELEFPKTPQGQADYLRALIRTVAATPGGHGAGICYWAADWIDGKKWNGPSWSGQWEQRALFDADERPRPALKALGTSIAAGRLPTRWSAEVSTANPLPDYPRPQMVRNRWMSLNGQWDYALSADDETVMPVQIDGHILVPFPFESALSGADRASVPDRRLWYRRQFSVPKEWSGQHVLLHFGAVNWQCQVWVNNRLAGEHRGGYDGFSFDITSFLASGTNQITVAVRNSLSSDNPNAQILGKQRAHPGGVLYTASTGIWQSVWMEPVPQTHIESLTLTPDVDAQTVHLTLHIAQPPASPAKNAIIIVTDNGKEVAWSNGPADAEIVLRIAHPHLWSPEDPHLYQLKARLADSGDAVQSYFAMRKVSLGKDAQGRTRILLNNRFVFEVGALDQGYWPDGLYTSPTDAALRYDIEMAKKLGFNLLRKHAKVEPERWYYWADRLGILVWQDVPQAFGDDFNAVTKEQWRAEMRHVIIDHVNHPSIIMWTLFNEGWGQHDTQDIAAEAKRLDPTRLINAASGGYNQPVNGVMSTYRLPTPAGIGDINDVHTYPEPTIENSDPTRALVCGEFGGISLRVPGHDWNQENFGYGAVMRDGWHLTKRYQGLLQQAYALRDNGASAVVYTQVADVEDETNGLLTYDREILKPLANVVSAANHGRFPPLPPPPADTDVMATSQDEHHVWAFTTVEPKGDWTAPDFDDVTWKSGAAPFGNAYPNIGTRWTDTPGDIWLRRKVALPQTLPDRLTILALHDEDVEIYVNGVLAAQAGGFTGEYAALPMSPEARAALRPGKMNVVAVHCRQTIGGQVIDVGITASD